MDTLWQHTQHSFLHEESHGQRSLRGKELDMTQVLESRQIGSGQQETARVNADILGISELKWTGMGEFNSDDHYIYYVGRNPLEEME